MRIIKTLLASLGLMLLASTNAVAMTQQDPQIKVAVHTDATNSTWYTTPAALAIGGLVVLVIILLLVMATRKKTTTTVIR